MAEEPEEENHQIDTVDNFETVENFDMEDDDEVTNRKKKKKKRKKKEKKDVEKLKVKLEDKDRKDADDRLQQTSKVNDDEAKPNDVNTLESTDVNMANKDPTIPTPVPPQ